MGNLERFIALGDSSGTGTIWTCCVTCLAHLAALCHLMSQTEPDSSGFMDNVCDLALENLGNISVEVHIERYSHFDVLTGVRIPTILLRTTETLTKDAHQVSWKRALDIIDARIGSRSDITSRSLRHWRRVIGKAYADFEAGFSEYGPALVVSLAMGMDTRTQDSSFPNLTLQEGRELCGI